MNWSRQQLQRFAHAAVPVTDEVATLVAANEKRWQK